MHTYIHICMYTHHSFKFQTQGRISEDCLQANHHFFQEVPHVQETTQYMIKYLHYLIFALNSIWLAFDSNATFDSHLSGVTLKSHLIPFDWHLIPLLLLCFVFPENLISFDLHLFLCSYCVLFFLRMYITLEELYMQVPS